MVEKKYTEEIIENLAVSREPLSPYDLTKKTKRSYSGIRENTIRLCKEGYVQLKSTEKSKTGVNRDLYTLTFKGVLKYLSSFYIFLDCFPDGSTTKTKKNIDECNEKFNVLHQKDLLNVFERQGKILDYIPFQECRWVLERASGIVRLMVIDATILLNEPLSGDAKMAVNISKLLSDPKTHFDVDDLLFLRHFENLTLRDKFGKVFLQNMVGRVKEENENLRQYAERILNEERVKISLLEQAVSLFSK